MANDDIPIIFVDDPWYEPPDGPLDVLEKISEAEFFLDTMRATPDPVHFRWLTSAFMGALRSALDWMAWAAYNASFDDEGNPRADQKAIQVLERYMTLNPRVYAGGELKKVFVTPEHPLLVQLSAIRQESAHRAAVWIHPPPGPEAWRELVHPSEVFAFGICGGPGIHERSCKLVLPLSRQWCELVQRIQEELW